MKTRIYYYIGIIIVGIIGTVVIFSSMPSDTWRDHRTGFVGVSTPDEINEKIDCLSRGGVWDHTSCSINESEPRISGKMAQEICSITGGECPPSYPVNIQEDGSKMVIVTTWDADTKTEKQFVFVIKNKTLSYEERVNGKLVPKPIPEPERDPTPEGTHVDRNMYVYSVDEAESILNFKLSTPYLPEGTELEKIKISNDKRKATLYYSNGLEVSHHPMGINFNNTHYIENPEREEGKVFYDFGGTFAEGLEIDEPNRPFYSTIKILRDDRIYVRAMMETDLDNLLNMIKPMDLNVPHVPYTPTPDYVMGAPEPEPIPEPEPEPTYTLTEVNCFPNQVIYNDECIYVLTPSDEFPKNMNKYFFMMDDKIINFCVIEDTSLQEREHASGVTLESCFEISHYSISDVNEIEFQSTTPPTWINIKLEDLTRNVELGFSPAFTVVESGWGNGCTSPTLEVYHLKQEIGHDEYTDDDLIYKHRIVYSCPYYEPVYPPQDVLRIWDESDFPEFPICEEQGRYLIIGDSGYERLALDYYYCGIDDAN